VKIGEDTDFSEFWWAAREAKGAVAMQGNNNDLHFFLKQNPLM